MSETILAAAIIVVLAISSFWFLATTLRTIWRNSEAGRGSSAGTPEENSSEAPPERVVGAEECYRFCLDHSYLLDEGASPSCASACGTYRGAS